MNHKDLAVWKESMKLVKEVYLLLKSYPSYEQFGICSQMRRAAVSIPSNIAEGAGRNSDKELLRFCLISQGSLAELETQLLISAELDYIKSNNDIFEQLITVRKILSGYISYLNTKLTKQSTSNPKS
ncbi:MAG: four helix bundle protein [Bacteroidales bacterium]|jgi:four helix bundle protein|nr:four helix bundle protein [Bacteroidales bacterium]